MISRLECSALGEGDISLLMPASFAEVLLRIYTKDERYVAHMFSVIL